MNRYSTITFIILSLGGISISKPSYQLCSRTWFGNKTSPNINCTGAEDLTGRFRCGECITSCTINGISPADCLTSTDQNRGITFDCVTHEAIDYNDWPLCATPSTSTSSNAYFGHCFEVFYGSQYIGLCETKTSNNAAHHRGHSLV